MPRLHVLRSTWSNPEYERVALLPNQNQFELHDDGGLKGSDDCACGSGSAIRKRRGSLVRPTSRAL